MTNELQQRHLPVNFFSIFWRYRESFTWMISIFEWQKDSDAK